MKTTLTTMLALCMILTLAACGGMQVEITTPESGAPAPSSQPPEHDYAAELQLEDFTVICYDKDGPGDRGYQYTLSDAQQKEFLELLHPQEWTPAGELPPSDLWTNGMLTDAAGERWMLVGEYKFPGEENKTLIYFGDQSGIGFFAPLEISDAFTAFAEPFRSQTESDKNADDQL
ncbi:MAG: hypothetical protein PHE47_08555 [Oscillospiraceae bacterium]|nr:hypothetical protein [Oscillospiraceae bacterium]